MANLYRWVEDECGNIAILQGESLVYDDFNFATVSVAERAVQLLNAGKGVEGAEAIKSILIASILDGVEEN